jgi:hypothetical protein
LAGTLTEEASGLLDTTKEFGNKLETTKKELDQDFTDDEIDDQLGDVDFVNDFAEQLYEAFDRLDKECDRVIKDCKDRKARLINALIWDKIGEEDEELMELVSKDAEIMAKFYDTLGSGCNKFYSAASNKFASDVKDMAKVISSVSAHKHIMMNYAREDFHKVKGALFNIVDDLIDVQRSIESTNAYFKKRAAYMKKRIADDKWKYQLKYSTGIT